MNEEYIRGIESILIARALIFFLEPTFPILSGFELNLTIS